MLDRNLFEIPATEISDTKVLLTLFEGKPVHGEPEGTVMKTPRHRIDPEGVRLPIKLDTTSNGEFVPVPLSPANRARERARAAKRRARTRSGSALGRRDFLVSACGAASTLLAFNAANAAAGRTGGFFDLPADAATRARSSPRRRSRRASSSSTCRATYVDPTEAWLKVAPETRSSGRRKPAARCADGRTPRSHLACLGSEEFVKDVFLDSDTDMMVLSFVPVAARRRAARRSRRRTTCGASSIAWKATHRLMIHGRVNPNQPGDLEDMDELKEQFGVCAWKTYTQWGPDGKGFFLDDEIGIRFVEKARALGVKVICVHKGLPFGHAVLRAQPVPRHRAGREALSGRRASSSTTRAS